MLTSLAQNKLFCLCCFLALLVIAILQFRLALFEQSEYSRKKGGSSQHKYQRNPYLLTWQAKQKHIFAADMDAAQLLYQQALTVNPLYIPAWLGLAELRFDQRQKQTANEILDYTNQLTSNIKRWRWDKALVAYQFDRKDILAGDLTYIIQELPGKTRNDALRMAFSVWPDPEKLLDSLGSDNLAYCFRYAINKRKVEQGTILWQMLESQGVEGHEKDMLAFINMLISQGEIDTAASIWRTYFNPNNILFNGGFTREPLQTAFGWRVGKNKGASWRLKQAKATGEPAALSLHFKRKKNINLSNIYQIVPLRGGKFYALKGQIKTAKLTTEQLPYFEVYGHKCKAPYSKTEMVKADQPWTDFYLLFKVPEECSSMIIRLRRKESNYIDNKLAGDIWLANLEIAETGELFTILDEQP